MTPKFRIGQILLNRNTKETGKVRRVYESDGTTKYEVALPGPQEYLNLSNRSNWDEEFLEFVQNQTSVENHPLVEINKNKLQASQYRRLMMIRS